MLNVAARRAGRGFTLVETLIALAMGAILVSAAVPPLQGVLFKSRRTEAIQALTAASLAQERWRADHADYAASLADLGLAASTPGGRYQLAIAEAGAEGYVLVARATAGGLQSRDAACPELRLVMQAGELRQEAADARGLLPEGSARRCWLQ